MIGDDKSRIHSPRRLLILAPSNESHATIPPFLHGLTGVAVPLEALQQQLATQAQSGGNETAPDTATPPSVFTGYTTHAPLQISTRYYTADIPIWVDELPAPSSQTSLSSNPAAWKDDFLSPEAMEVRDAIGAIIVCVQKPELAGLRSVSAAVLEPEEKKEMEEELQRSIDGIRDAVRAVADVKIKIEEERGGGIGDVPGLAILVGKEEAGETQLGGEGGGDGNGELIAGGGGADDEFGDLWWDEQLNDGGHVSTMEITSWDPREGLDGFKVLKGGRNEFGELMGMERIKEVLESNEWSSRNDADFDDSDSSDIGLGKYGDDSAGGSLHAEELEREMAGLRLAINTENGDDVNDDRDRDGVDNDDIKVDQLEGIMLRVQAIRDMGHDLPEAERKSFARKAINDLMRGL